MKNIARLFAVALAPCLTGVALAYLPSSHQRLSEQAAARSNLALDSTLLSDLGLGPWSAVDYTASNGTPSTAQTIIAFGARYEDEAQTFRGVNHFFDPQFQNFTGRGLDNPSLAGVPSPDWGLEDRGEVVSTLGVGPQVFSYRHAQQQYFSMLTAGTPPARRAAASGMLQMLGMTIHHLQDMAQPQHTRNEAHPPFNPTLSLYEFYTATKVDAQIASGAFTNSYPIPVFATARQFWHSVASQADSIPRYIGMAEFTGQNYVSLTSMFSVSPSGAIFNNQGIPGFPLPSGTSADGTPKHLVRRTESIPLPDGSTQTETMEYIVGNVFDGFRGTSSPDRLLASRSILTGPNSGQPKAFAVGPTVWDDNYGVLLPRAIAFSTGLINHFFRGRMNLRRNPSGSGWFIDNVGQEDLSGSFAVYYDDASGNRQAITGAAWRTVIPATQSLQVVFTEPPTGTSRLVAVFAGQIGLEGDPAAPASGFFATAGKVVPYSPPPTSSCGAPIHSTGSSGVSDHILTIGGDTQSVTANFDAYSIPDKLELSANGTSLAGTGGFVSGLHSFTFTFNPSQLGTTQLLARVTGNPDPGTAWNLCVDCNNPAGATCQTVTQRQVTFGFNYVTTTRYACKAGNMSVDGQPIGALNSPGFITTMVTVNPAAERHTLYAPEAGCVCTGSVGCGPGTGDPNPQFTISYRDGSGTNQTLFAPLTTQLQFDIR